MSVGSKSTFLVSKTVSYQGRINPAIYMVWDVRSGGKIHRVKALMFNRGRAHYQAYLYAHRLSPEALKTGDLFWQQLTSGLSDQRT